MNFKSDKVVVHNRRESSNRMYGINSCLAHIYSAEAHSWDQNDEENLNASDRSCDKLTKINLAFIVCIGLRKCVIRYISYGVCCCFLLVFLSDDPIDKKLSNYTQWRKFSSCMFNQPDGLRVFFIDFGLVSIAVVVNPILASNSEQQQYWWITKQHHRRTHERCRLPHTVPFCIICVYLYEYM